MSDEKPVDAGPSAENTNSNLYAQLEEARIQAEKFKNDYLYLRAEFDNYKKNVIKERADLVKYGSERLLHEILSSLDNFERALEIKVSSENFQNFYKGIDLTAKSLTESLRKFGVTAIDQVGVAFDPMTHEALSSEESAQFDEGCVSRVFKKGYRLHDKLIRPAQVVVAKKPKAEA